jgi:transglutaminase-like putative cysteine protease
MLCAAMLAAGVLCGCGSKEAAIDDVAIVSVSLFEPRAGDSVDDTLYNAILNRDASCGLSDFQLTESEFSDGYDLWKMTSENPAVDYLSNYSWQSTNGIVTKVDFEYESIPSDYRARLEQAVAAAIQSVKEHLQDGYEQAELVCAISDCIVVNCQYAYMPDGVTPDNDGASTAYSALVNGRAVCDGYAGAFTLLSQQFGLEAREISGKSDPGDASHAWNMVKAGGVWYHVDTTWNDPVPDRPEQAGHDYLLLSDNAMANQRNGSQQRHASWEADAPAANDSRYDNVFWIYEDMPISFAAMHFDEWETSIAQTTFEDVITAAVENNTDANVARFGFDKDELAAEIHKLYPNIGCTYTIQSNGVVIKVGEWKK